LSRWSFLRRRGRGGGPDWRAHVGPGDTRHGLGECGEVEGCQVIDDVFAHAGQVDGIGLLQPGESRRGEDGQLAAAVGVGFDPLDQSLTAQALDDAGQSAD
jgi:hypothetical protein